MREADLARRGQPGGRMLPRVLLLGWWVLAMSTLVTSSGIGNTDAAEVHFVDLQHVETQQSTAEEVEGGKDRTGTSEVPNSPASPRDPEEPSPEGRRQPTIHERSVLLFHARRRCALQEHGSCCREAPSRQHSGGTSSRSTECPSVGAQPRWNDFGVRLDSRPARRGPEDSGGQHERAPGHDPLQHDDQGP